MSKSQDFSASFPYSDILSEDIQQEIFQTVGSQDMNDILNGDLVNDSPYIFDQTHQSIHDDTTVSLEDIKNFFPMHQLLPTPADGVLSNEEYAGPYDFEVAVLPNYKSKNPWVYSPLLNKVYMDMMQQFPVDFKIRNRPDKQLFIRTTPQYSAHNYAAEPVMRCIQHEFHSDPTNKDILEHVRQHVMRCTNKLSQYLGNKQDTQRLSIIFPFSMPQAGVDTVRELFFFVCKSSCNTPGMARRGIEVIFTLEDEHGDILGRKCLNVRICACPKRDKDKEESEYRKEKPNNVAPRGKKRKASHPPANSGKVVRDSTPPQEELREYSLQLKVTGKHNLLKILTMVEDLNTAEIFRHTNQPAEKLFRNNLSEVQELKNILHLQ